MYCSFILLLFRFNYITFYYIAAYNLIVSFILFFVLSVYPIVEGKIIFKKWFLFCIICFLTYIYIAKWISVIHLIIFSQKTIEHGLSHEVYAIINAGRNLAIWTDLHSSDKMIQQRTENLIADINDTYIYYHRYLVVTMVLLRKVLLLYYIMYHQLPSNVTDNYSRIQLCPNMTFEFTLNFNFKYMFVDKSQIRTYQLIHHYHHRNQQINKERCRN